MNTYYENHSGGISSTGLGSIHWGRDEVSMKWRLGGYKPGNPTGGSQGGDSGLGVDKSDAEKQGSKHRNNPYY
jgi:hypothetical protein